MSTVEPLPDIQQKSASLTSVSHDAKSKSVTIKTPTKSSNPSLPGQKGHHPSLQQEAANKSTKKKKDGHSNGSGSTSNLKFKLETSNSPTKKVTVSNAKRKAFEHRHYFALHPTCNMILAKRWEEKSMQLHKSKLKQAKPSIDNSQPRVYPHLEMRLKGVQIEEERLQDIERKNHILLNRISFQMLNPSEVSSLHIHTEEETVALLIDAGDHKRKRDKEKITKENLVFLQRIEDKAPNYNRLEWFNERRKNLEHLANISKYPFNYMDDLEEYEEKFPFRGRTPGGTHHPRSQTHDPDDHYRRSNQNSDALESEATKDQKPVRAATSEPIKTKKKSHEVVAPPKTMNMTTTEPEEPLVSIPSRHHSAKSQLVQISDAAGTQAKSPDLTPKTDSDIIPEELPAVLNDQVPLTRQATIPSAEIPEESLATASSKAGSEVKLNDQPIEEVISSGSTYSLVDKSPVETNVEAKLEVEEASQMPTEDTSNHTDDPRTTLSDSENRAEEPVVASVPQTVDSTPEPETSSSQQNIKSSKNNVSSIPPSAIPKSLKGSTKSLIKAASESHVISNSRTGSKSKLNNPPSPALPSNSKKGSTKSLVKAASESRVIGKGGSLAGSKSKLNQSFVVSSKTGSIKSLSKGEPPEAQPTEATETKETTEQPSEQDDPSLEY